ncbi:hypothetical protein SRHO_G00324940 [Serrasalmus rhombeus]
MRSGPGVLFVRVWRKFGAEGHVCVLHEALCDIPEGGRIRNMTFSIFVSKLGREDLKNNLMNRTDPTYVHREKGMKSCNHSNTIQGMDGNGN